VLLNAFFILFGSINCRSKKAGCMIQSPSKSRKPWLRRWRGRLLTMWQKTMSQNGAPERVALGGAIGFFIGWLPIVGVQMGVSLAVCAALRANFIASLPGVWISNPITILPMYWLINQFGALFAGRAMTWEGMGIIYAELIKLSIWDGTMYLFTEVGNVTLAMFIGGGIIGITNAAMVYPIVLVLVRRYQQRLEERRTHWRKVVLAR
jgi:uncharacterized protein